MTKTIIFSLFAIISLPLHAQKENKTDANYRTESKKIAPAPKERELLEESSVKADAQWKHYFSKYSLIKDNQPYHASILKAYQANASAVELYPYIFDYFLHYGQVVQFANLLNLWSVASSLPKDLLQYSKNLLLTTQGGILITDGAYDTYPLFVLQNSESNLSNVAVINYNKIKDKGYRTTVCNYYNLPNPGKNVSLKTLLYKLKGQNINKKIYVSLTVDKSLLQTLADKLYLVGLAYEFKPNSTQPELQLIQKNYEKRYQLAYLNTLNDRKQFSRNKLNKLALNYVPAGLLLLDYYRNNNKPDKAKQIKQILYKLAKRCGKADLIKKY